MTFPAVHADVGDIQIYDDGDEITVVAGNFTHGHFSNYEDISEEESERMIAENVADFLEKLFSDKVVLLGSHKGGGECRVVDPDTVISGNTRKNMLGQARDRAANERLQSCLDDAEVCN